MTTRGVVWNSQRCSINRIGIRALDLYGLNFFHLASEFQQKIAEFQFQNIISFEFQNSPKKYASMYLAFGIPGESSGVRGRGHRTIRLFKNARTGPLMSLEKHDFRNDHED